MPNFLLGFNAKLYLGSALFTATPTISGGGTLTEMSNVKDVTVNTEAATADTTTRATTGWRTQAPTLRRMELSFTMQWKPSDAQFSAIKTAYLTNAEVAAVALDQDKTTSGAQGPAANFIVSKFEKKEPLEETQTVDVTLIASSFPTWLVVGS